MKIMVTTTWLSGCWRDLRAWRGGVWSVWRR
jgi:hypothetical protein